MEALELQGHLRRGKDGEGEGDVGGMAPCTVCSRVVVASHRCVEVGTLRSSQIQKNVRVCFRGAHFSCSAFCIIIVVTFYYGEVKSDQIHL